jgi:hypothetical protein
MVTVWELLEEWTQNTWEGVSYIIQLSMDSRSDAHKTMDGTEDETNCDGKVMMQTAFESFLYFICSHVLINLVC